MISFEPKLLHLFDESSYALVDLRMRRLLGNRALAKWLYAYLVTHSAGACDTRGGRIRALCGSSAQHGEILSGEFHQTLC